MDIRPPRASLSLVFLELSEALACPRCGPPQVLVVLIREMEGRRVGEGTLGCPACEATFAIRSGTVMFAGDDEETARGGSETALLPPDAAVVIAALLGTSPGGGPLLLGPGLWTAAAELSRLAGGVEVLALATGAELGAGAGPPAGVPGAARVSTVRTSEGARFPVLGRRFAGVALLTASELDVEEAARALTAGGRLVVLQPGPGLAPRLGGAGLEVLAADPRAMVARRP